MNTPYLKPGLAALGAVIGLVSVSGLAQDNDDLDRKLRELNIMNNIFEAAMEEDRNARGNRRRIGNGDSFYLAGQGMVFTFRLQNNMNFRLQSGVFDEDWMNDMRVSMARASESLERVRLSFPDLDFDFDFDVDVDENQRSVFIARGQGIAQPPQPAQPVQQMFFFGNKGPEQEAAREMEAAMRDIQEEVRDKQRDIRDLERDIRNREGGDIQSLQARIDELEADMDSELAKLETQRSAYEVFLSDLQKARQEQQLIMAEEVSTQLINTLCDYGATLRSLSNNEHVTIILEDVVDDKDQVYVFNYSDISDCRSPDTLKQQAVSYQLSGN